MAFTEKKIKVQFTYGTGANGDGEPTEATTATIDGCRVSMVVSVIGGEGLSQCSGRIYGMDLSLMNKLSRVGRLAMMYNKNVMTVYAGDENDGMSQVFQGNVQIAYPDLMSAPEVSFAVSAFSGAFEQLKPAPISSFPGTVNAAVFLENLANQMNVKFENSGVSVILPSSYYYGSAREQAKKVVRDARIEWNGIENGVLAIWPKDGKRNGLIPLLSTKTGMIGYPSYMENGIYVKTMYNPSIKFGALVKVESDIEKGNGQWKVQNMTHNLESKVPGGSWHTDLQLVLPGIFGEEH